jgi:hypothetical protein
MKSAASIDQPGGISALLIYTYFARICSLISLLFLPVYGLLPNIHSYPTIPIAK